MTTEPWLVWDRICRFKSFEPRVVLVFWLLVLSSVWVLGQAETGSISGLVADTSNAVVVGANVAVVSGSTGLRRTTSTGSAGEYVISNLKPDTYYLTIEHSGFQTYTTARGITPVLADARNFEIDRFFIET